MHFPRTTLGFCFVLMISVFITSHAQLVDNSNVDRSIDSNADGGDSVTKKEEDATLGSYVIVNSDASISAEYSSQGGNQGLSHESEVESGEVYEQRQSSQSSQEEGEIVSLESGDTTVSQESSSKNTTSEEFPLDPVGRKLPPIRVPFQNHPIPENLATSTPPVAPVVVGHSMDVSEELEVHVAGYDQNQAIDAGENIGATSSATINEKMSSDVVPENHIELSTVEYVTRTSEEEATRRNVIVINSVQTSRSTEDSEVLYNVSNESDSGEEYSDESKEKEKEEETTTTTSTTTQTVKVIEQVVTSKSVIQSEIKADEEEIQNMRINVDNNVTTQMYKSVTYVTNNEQQASTVDSSSLSTTTPTTTTTTSTTSSPLITELVPTINNDNLTTTNIQPILETTPSTTTTTTVVQSESPIGKSLKSLFEQQNIMTEDPSVLAKLLPQTTTNKMMRTFTDKTGKTFTLKLLTEDPNILAAMTPPPRNTTTTEKTPEKQERVIFDKASGKNITLQLQTEDPKILAAMTPPPRPSDNTTSSTISEEPTNITTTTEKPTTTTPLLAHYPGVPQQFGKLPIITRQNVTRKPFLRAKNQTRNTRPGPVIRKLSDIVNRSRIAASKRPYFVKQSHEGQYQQDPERKNVAEITVVTTRRTTTTLSPYFRWGKSLLISGNIKVVDGADWSEELRDSTTVKFKKLANEIEGQLDKLFRSSPRISNKFKGAQIDSFSKGSVLVDYTLFLKEDTRGTVEDILRNTFREGLNESYLGSFKVDPLYANFKVVTPEIIYAPPSSEETNGFPHWAIAIVGSGIAAIVFLIVLFTIRKCTVRATRRKYGAPLTNDAQQERKTSEKISYDNPVADEGVYDLDNVWNEKKPRPRTNSSTPSQNNSGKNMNSTYASGSQYSRKSQENPYLTTQLFRRDSFGKNPYAYNNNNKNHNNVGINQSSNYDAYWNEWEDFYEIKHDPYIRRDRDYDTTF